MFTNVTQSFAPRWSRLALVVTVVCCMAGTALVAYFAPNLVEYFASSSYPTWTGQTEFYPLPANVP
jgi:hypothetical protein